MIKFFKNIIKDIRYSLFNFPVNFFTDKPLKNRNYYKKLMEDEANYIYPEIDNYINKIGFEINKNWLDDLALSTQVVIKKSKLNYQHGRILYSSLRNYINNSKHNNITVFETGTSRGFSSICMSKAINDASIHGKVITLDILPHNTKMYWNIIHDHEQKQTRAELLAKWNKEMENIIFLEGWTNRQIKKIGISRINFAFLDAQHEYENVLQEFLFVMKRQKKNDIVFFDDVTMNKFQGVYAAVEYISKNFDYSVDYISSSENRCYAIARKN